MALTIVSMQAPSGVRGRPFPVVPACSCYEEAGTSPANAHLNSYRRLRVQVPSHAQMSSNSSPSCWRPHRCTPHLPLAQPETAPTPTVPPAAAEAGQGCRPSAEQRLYEGFRDRRAERRDHRSHEEKRRERKPHPRRPLFPRSARMKMRPAGILAIRSHSKAKARDSSSGPTATSIRTITCWKARIAST